MYFELKQTLSIVEEEVIINAKQDKLVDFNKAVLGAWTRTRK